VDAIRAVDMAAIIATASQPHQQPAPVASSPPPARHAAAAPRRPAASTLAGSVLRDAVIAVGGLIVLLVVALLVVRSRRERGRAAAPGRARTRGQHENRKPDRGPAPAEGSGTAPDARAGPALAGRPGPPAAASWTSPSGWQGGGIGEIRPGSSRSVVAPAPKSSSGYRSGRTAGRPDGAAGPPWAAAPEPRRLLGPLPVASAGPPPPEPGRGIRVPRDMAAPGATTEPEPAVSFDLSTPPADFDLATPAFGLTPPAFDTAPPAFDASPPRFDAAPPAFDAAPPRSDAAPPAFDTSPPAFEAAPASDPEPPGPGSGPPASDTAQTRTEALPTRQSLGFAAAPVPADYPAPPAGRAGEDAPGHAAAADPSYIWDLAATDVFPAASGAAVPPDDAPEAGQD